MITVYGRATSSNVQLVMWLIGELALDHKRLDYGHNFGGVDTPEYLAMNPHGLVPVITDGGGAPIFESGAIARYLASRYGGAPFWPEDAAARAQIDKWAEWAKVSLGAAFSVPIFWVKVRTPAAKRDEAALKQNIARFEALLDRLSPMLEAHDHICGDDFTLADIMVGHLLFRYYDMEIERADLPAIEAYYARLQARPAYARHVMVDYSALRAEGA